MTFKIRRKAIHKFINVASKQLTGKEEEREEKEERKREGIFNKTCWSCNLYFVQFI